MDSPAVLDVPMAIAIRRTLQHADPFLKVPDVTYIDHPALDAIIDGRTVVVERRTEAEWRAVFDEHYGDDFIERRGTCEWTAWLVLARSLGLVRGE